MEERAKQLRIDPRELEEAMVRHFQHRKETLKNELGYLNYTAPGWVEAARNVAQQHSGQGYGLPFMAQRHLAQLIYNGEMDWRAPLFGGIWTKSNIHLPITRRFVQQQAARAVANLVGTAPFFTATAVPKKNPAARQQAQDLASLLDKWSQFEATNANLQGTLSEAISNAFVNGEQVCKTIFEEQVQYYQAIETVAINAQGPIVTQDGGYIYQQDTWMEVENPITGIASMVLARDGRTPKPEGQLAFKKMRVPKKLVQFSGAQVLNVPFTSFLAPLPAASLNKADCCFHLRSDQLVSLVSRYASLDMGTGVSPQQMQERISRLIYDFGSSARSTEADFRPDQAPRADLSESLSMLGTDTQEPTITIAEGFGWFDALQNGSPAYITLIMDDASDRVLYYDWAANPLDWNKGFAPFDVIRINPVEGRWHGRGQVALFDKIQTTIDLNFNRWNLSQMKSGRIDVVKRAAFEELMHDPTLPINGGTTLTLRDGFTREDALFAYYLQETKGSDLNALIEVLMQIATNLSGTANGNDANAAGLDTSQTATGINNIAQSGDELSSTWTRQCKPSVESIVKAFLRLTSETLRSPRAFSYFAGDEQVLAEVSPEQVTNLDLMVNLTMTQAKARTIHENKTAAYGIIKSYYMELPPQVQNAIGPFVRQWLKDAFQVEDADEIIQAMAPPPLPEGAPPAPGEAPPAEAPAEAPAPQEEIPL
jgi:hypothetical protein